MNLLSHTAVTTPSTLRLLLARTTLGPHRSRAESRRLLLARDYSWPVTPATGVPDHWAANTEKEATLTKQANDFRGRILIFAGRYFRERIFSREDIFAGRYFRVNSIFAKISSRENISNSPFAKFPPRENKVLYSSVMYCDNAVHVIIIF